MRMILPGNGLPVTADRLPLLCGQWRQELYTSPQVKVVEIKMQGAILAASNPGSTDSYDIEEW